MVKYSNFKITGQRSGAEDTLLDWQQGLMYQRQRHLLLTQTARINESTNTTKTKPLSGSIPDCQQRTLLTSKIRTDYDSNNNRTK